MLFFLVLPSRFKIPSFTWKQISSDACLDQMDFSGIKKLCAYYLQEILDMQKLSHDYSALHCVLLDINTRAPLGAVQWKGKWQRTQVAACEIPVQYRAEEITARVAQRWLEGGGLTSCGVPDLGGAQKGLDEALSNPLCLWSWIQLQRWLCFGQRFRPDIYRDPFQAKLFWLTHFIQLQEDSQSLQNKVDKVGRRRGLQAECDLGYARSQTDW